MSQLFEILNTIQRWWSSALEWVFNPLWEYYIITGIVLIVCLIIAVFVPFKWGRLALGLVVLLRLAYTIGAKRMYDQVKKAADDEAAARVQREQEERARSNDGRWKPW